MPNFLRQLLIFILFGFGFLWLPNQVLAAEYYVSPSGNDQNPGTIDQPFRTIQGNIWRLYPGDTMILRGGSYTGQTITVNRSGQVDKPITFKAYPGEKPVLSQIPGPTQAIYAYDKDYIVFDGINVDTVDGHWVSLWLSSHITIKNCELRNVTRNIMGFYVIHSDHIKIQNCVMDQVSSNTITQDKDLIHLENTHYSLLENLTLTRGPHALISLQNSTYNIIRNNTLHNQWQKNIGLAAPARTDLGRNIIENNKIFGSRAAILAGYQGKGAMGIYNNQKGNIIRNNVIYDNENFGILMDGNNSLGNSSVTQNKIYHNVIHKNGYRQAYDANAGVTITDFYSGIDMTQNAIKNNIISDNTRYALYVNSKQSGLANNVFAGNCVYHPLDATKSINLIGGGILSLTSLQQNFSTLISRNVEGNPLYTSGSDLSGDFTLQAGSPCIDIGTSLTNTTAAGSGTRVTVQDAGYFSNGFGLTTGDMIQIGRNNPVRLTAVDYATNALTIESAQTWQAQDSVNLPFQGAAPDAGKNEVTGSSGGTPTPPPAPASPVPSPPPSPTTPCVADINGDRRVTQLDLDILLQNFYPASLTNAKADLNADGAVDLSDYSLLVAQWGRSCS